MKAKIEVDHVYYYQFTEYFYIYMILHISKTFPKKVAK